MTPGRQADGDCLIKNFPYEKFVWTIETARGVSLLSGTALHIQPIRDNDSASDGIQCTLHADMKPLTFRIPYIRYPLDYSSMRIILQRIGKSFSDADRETLPRAVSFLSDFEIRFPAMVNALCGQERGEASVSTADFIHQRSDEWHIFPTSHRL